MIYLITPRNAVCPLKTFRIPKKAKINNRPRVCENSKGTGVGEVVSLLVVSLADPLPLLLEDGADVTPALPVSDEAIAEVELLKADVLATVAPIFEVPPLALEDASCTLPVKAAICNVLSWGKVSADH